MKKFIIYLVSFLFVIIFSSCDNTNTPTKPDDAPLAQIAIIKLTPEIQKQVFVSPIVDSIVVDYSKMNLSTLYYGDGLVLCNPTTEDSILVQFAQEQFHLLGGNPYIILDNGYAVIDWKWAHFQPLSGYYRNALYWHPEIQDNKATLPNYSTNPSYQNGKLVNEEYYVLSVNWSDLKDLNAIWSMEQGSIIEKPEIKYANIVDIEKYAHVQNDDQYNIFNTELNAMYSLYSRKPEEFDDCIEKFDSLQASYIETLNQMIKNNDFEIWTH